MSRYVDIEEFTFVGFKIEIKKDLSKCWRIYVTKNERIKIMPYDIPYQYDGYGDCRDSSFVLDDFPFALWNYGDKIGLDEFPYSAESKDKFHKEDKEWTLEQIRELAKELVDCIIAYQKNFQMINEFRRFDYNLENIRGIGNSLYKTKNLDMLKKYNDILEGNLKSPKEKETYQEYAERLSKED